MAIHTWRKARLLRLARDEGMCSSPDRAQQMTLESAEASQGNVLTRVAISVMRLVNEPAWGNAEPVAQQARSQI
jgi:hypothetical protein